MSTIVNHTFRAMKNKDEMPLITVILPAHNSALTLPKVFEGLLSTNLDKNFMEVIIVDDASSDSTMGVVKNFVDDNGKIFGDIAIVRLNENKGVSYARNMGLKRAKGKLVFLLDSDVILNKFTLKRLLELVKKDKVGVVSALCLSEKTSFLEKIRYLKYYGRVVNGDVLTGAALSKRETMERVGFFNESLGYPFSVYEDLEYTMRVRKAGYRVLVDGRDPLLHFKGSASSVVFASVSQFKHIFKRLATYFTFSKARAFYQVLKVAPLKYKCEHLIYLMANVTLIVSALTEPIISWLAALALLLVSILYYTPKYQGARLRLIAGPMILGSRLIRVLTLSVYIVYHLVVARAARPLLGTPPR